LPGLGIGAGIGAGVGAGLANRTNWNDGPGARQDYMNDRIANRQDRAAGLEDRMQGRQDNRQANRETRQGDRQTNRGDRQDNRQENRGDRQENRGDRWDEASDNFWDNAHDMYHDHWHGDYGDYWDHMWEHHPVASAFAVTGWAVNRASYWFGYGGGYYNPYYSDSGSYGGGGSYAYSEPLPTYEQVYMPAETVATATATAPGATSADPSASSEPTPLAKAYDEARQAFYEGDYAKALDRTNAALAIAPYDAALHEFKALTLFASGKYPDAAATIHTVLAVGPGWDWTTFVRMYPSVDTYTAQLRALESAVVANPKAADLHFLLAYHYITCGSTTEAVGQLQEVIELQPKDTVSVQLLQMIGGPGSLPKTSTAGPPKAGAAVQAVSISKKDLMGSWKAKGEGDSSFGLKLADDSTFAWTYTEKGKAKTIEGVFAVEQNTLALQPDAGGVMVAELTQPQNGKFHFQVVGAPPGDKGLEFSK
jgi:tetratricopeptide (TPR) repeat protein